MLDKKILSALLKDIDVRIFDTVSSTNTVAVELSKGQTQDMLVAAATQTDGRGRQGKSFFSPDGGVYFSLVTHPKCELADAVSVTSAAAVFVAKVIEELTELSPKIKWVNDIYIGGKKVCGILCQSVFEGGKLECVVIGIGINVKPQNFPEDISSVAGSLNADIDANILVAKIAEKVFDFCKNPCDKSYLEYYKKNSCVIGEKIIFYENGFEHYGKALGIDDNAALIVEENGTTKKLTGGEITVRVKK